VADGSLFSGDSFNSYTLIARKGKELGSKVIVDTSDEALRLSAEAGVVLFHTVRYGLASGEAAVMTPGTELC